MKFKSVTGMNGLTEGMSGTPAIHNEPLKVSATCLPESSGLPHPGDSSSGIDTPSFRGPKLPKASAPDSSSDKVESQEPSCNSVLTPLDLSDEPLPIDDGTFDDYWLTFIDPDLVKTTQTDLVNQSKPGSQLNSLTLPLSPLAHDHTFGASFPASPWARMREHALGDPLRTDDSGSSTGRASLSHASSRDHKRRYGAFDGADSHGFSDNALEARFGRGQGCNLACPYYKMNPKRYMRCGERSIGNISALGQHLRIQHSRKPIHCEQCFESFQEQSSLQHHRESDLCCPTGGCAADDLGTPPRKRRGPWSTWYWFWDRLFPSLPRPHSPYTDGLEVVEQFALSAIERVIWSSDLEGSAKNDLIRRLLKESDRWRAHPAKPLNHSELGERLRSLLSGE